MKNLITNKKSLIVLSLVFIASFSFGRTYTTIDDGKWDDKTSVWSLDGKTPCNCSPGEISKGNDIIINNNISTSYDITINNRSQLIVSNEGFLTGSYSAYINDAIVKIRGHVELAEYKQDSSTFFKLEKGGGMNLFHTCIIENGDFNICEGEMNLSSGNLTIGNRGFMCLGEKATLSIDYGNFIVKGVFYNNSAECFESVISEDSNMAEKK